MFGQPCDPISALSEDAVVTQLGEGDETITVNGKIYTCHWWKGKAVATTPKPLEGTFKWWLSKDVPVDGVVRQEISMKSLGSNPVEATSSVELVDSGRQQ